MLIPQALQHPRTGMDLIRGFYQHGAGNCAAIAAIKCSIAAFGVTPVYREAREDGGTLGVEARDGFKLELNADELELARRRSFFAGTDVQLLAHAHLLSAIMAKRAQLEGNDGRGGMVFGEAIDSLNDGEFWLEGPAWLGLKNNIMYGPNRSLPGSSAAKDFLAHHEYGIGKSAKHVWFASKGVHDEYGTPSGPRWAISGAITLDVSRK